MYKWGASDPGSLSLGTGSIPLGNLAGELLYLAPVDNGPHETALLVSTAGAHYAPAPLYPSDTAPSLVMVWETLPMTGEIKRCSQELFCITISQGVTWLAPLHVQGEDEFFRVTDSLDNHLM